MLFPNNVRLNENQSLLVKVRETRRIRGILTGKRYISPFYVVAFHYTFILRQFSLYRVFTSSFEVARRPLRLSAPSLQRGGFAVCKRLRRLTFLEATKSKTFSFYRKPPASAAPRYRKFPKTKKARGAKLMCFASFRRPPNAGRAREVTENWPGPRSVQ